MPRNPLFDDPIFRHFFGDSPEMRPGGPTAQSLGSGVLVDPSGLVVTNYHVVEGMTDVKVALADRREFAANIVLRDQRTDLAVLRLKDSGPFPFMEFDDSDALQVGDLVLAIGDPFGVGETVTQGIVSALARTEEGISNFGFFIQTDAAINPGNSGGALVDMNGRLVGINSAIVSQTGSSVGIGLAIPANMVKIVVATAKSGGKEVKRPWLGAGLQSVTKEIAESLGLDRPAGVLVTDVTPNSPAEVAGLQHGDLITSIDQQPVVDVEDFSYRFATRPLGSTASLAVMRAGKPLTLSVKLVTAPELPRDPIRITGDSPFAGATVINLSPAVADEYSIEVKARRGGQRCRGQFPCRRYQPAKGRRGSRCQRHQDHDDARSRKSDERSAIFLEDQHQPRQSGDYHRYRRLSGSDCIRCRHSGSLHTLVGRLATCESVLQRGPKLTHFIGRLAIDFGDPGAFARRFLIVDAGANEGTQSPPIASSAAAPSLTRWLSCMAGH